MGKVVLVGAGPGDPGLITIKGLIYIRKAQCIIYDRLISTELLQSASSGCELIYAGKENHNHTMPQDDINQLLYEKSQQYELVVRLKGGDPYVFGRGGEEALFLNKRNVEIEVCPGVTSAIAVSSYAGIPVTHRGISRGFHVITSHGKTDKITDIDFSSLAEKRETCIFLMGLSHVKEIAEGLMNAGRDENTPVAVISNGTRNSQKKCVGKLSDIHERVKHAGIQSPAIIVVGDVVNLENELSFFEKRVLFGRKYIVPYILAGQFSFESGWHTVNENTLIKSLSDYGACVVSVPIGQINPVNISNIDQNGLKDVLEADFIIFTSKNAVNATMWNLKEHGMDIRSLGKARIAAVGMKTAKEIERFGLICDVISKGSTAADLGRALIPELSKSTKVVWMSAARSSEELEEMLADKCDFLKICCYENADCPNESNCDIQVEIRDCDGIVFTSGSAAERFYTMATMAPGNVSCKVYSIGPVCTEHLRSLGAENILEAKKSNYESLIVLILSDRS